MRARHGVGRRVGPAMLAGVLAGGLAGCGVVHAGTGSAGSPTAGGSAPTASHSPGPGIPTPTPVVTLSPGPVRPSRPPEVACPMLPAVPGRNAGGTAGPRVGSTQPTWEWLCCPPALYAHPGTVGGGPLTGRALPLICFAARGTGGGGSIAADGCCGLPRGLPPGAG